MGIGLGILAVSALGSFGTASVAGGAAIGLRLLNKFPSKDAYGIQPLPNAPSSQSKEVQDAELAERDRIRLAKGRSSTILTGSSNLGTAPTQTKTLLGGN